MTICSLNPSRGFVSSFLASSQRIIFQLLMSYPFHYVFPFPISMTRCPAFYIPFFWPSTHQIICHHKQPNISQFNPSYFDLSNLNLNPTQTHPKMFGRRRQVVTTTAPRRSMFGRRQNVHTTTSTTRTGQRHGLFGRRKQVVHHKRHASIGDKISGAMLKLKGSLTHRPGVKVCFHHLSILNH